MEHSELSEGIIIRSVAGFCYVEAGNRVYECKPRGSFRKANISPVAGDRVLISLQQEKGTVEKICERKNFLVRPPLANLDKLFIVSSSCIPAANPLLIDRMTAVCEHLGIMPVIVFNKSDLGGFGELPEVYRNAGYKTYTVSAENGDGIDALKLELKGCISAFSGNSGVGKSSILNRLLPDLNLTTGDVSSKLGRGRHTTRQVELIKTDDGYVADTPGFSSLEITDFTVRDKDELKYCFPEFAPFLLSCRFTSCSHTSEQGCGVIGAVDDGKISKSRHDSYVSMYSELKKINPWELKKP